MDTHSIATSCLVNLANATHESSEVRLAAALELLRQPARVATDTDRERFLGLAGAIAKFADQLDADPVDDSIVQSIARDLRIYLERFGYAVPEEDPSE